jgi:hypothetical protein
VPKSLRRYAPREIQFLAGGTGGTSTGTSDHLDYLKSDPDKDPRETPGRAAKPDAHEVLLSLA